MREKTQAASYWFYKPMLLVWEGSAQLSMWEQGRTTLENSAGKGAGLVPPHSGETKVGHLALKCSLLKPR